VVQKEELKKCVILEKHCLEVHASRQAFLGHCCGRRKLKGRSGRKWCWCWGGVGEMCRGGA
jgi:hypothetical protein